MVTNNKLSYYEVLEVSFDCDEQKIKAAFRRLARKYHPDVNPSKDAIEKFKRITEAYETLSDKIRREKYDALNNFISKNNQTNRTHAQNAYKEQKTTSKKTSTPYRQTYKESKESKNSFNDIFNDILEGLKKTKTPPKKPEAVNGTDINTSITITQKESLEGTSRTVNILHTQLCPKCNGRRFINGSFCQLCNGKGETSVQKKINVKIPAYVKEGSKIRIANEGNQGLHGGTNGDLYLTITIEKSSQFTYEYNNAFTTIPVTPFEAALGASIEIPTPNGTVSMKIPACTSSGQKFRLNEQGLKSDNGKVIGDLVVTVKIDLPKTLTEEEKLLYEQIKLASKHNVRENLAHE